MGKTTTMTVEICYGDCDPAGLVCLPRYQRWMEAAAVHFFMMCGTQWHEAADGEGVVGTLLLEHCAKFIGRATHGDSLLIRTHIEDWRPREFQQKHVITRREELICECTETRMFCHRDPNDRHLVGIAVPEVLRRLCE